MNSESVNFLTIENNTNNTRNNMKSQKKKKKKGSISLWNY